MTLYIEKDILRNLFNIFKIFDKKIKKNHTTLFNNI